MTSKRKRGFTLIELMIVVAIIAILAVVAASAWGRYAYRARRGDGQNILMHIAQAEERYYTDFNKYTKDPTDLDYAAGTITSAKGYYTVTLASASSSQFVATATPQGAQAKDACGSLSIDGTGLKKPVPTDTAANSNGSCW